VWLEHLVWNCKELQHLVARSSRAIACNAARDCELLFFMFRPDTYVMHAGYLHYGILHQESIPGVIVALKHSLGLFLTIYCGNSMLKIVLKTVYFAGT
jgi:hypothetical protein